nr:hypothetical protein [Streptomyces hygroscopicus]
MDVVLAYHRRDPVSALATTRLVRTTPALCARLLEKQDGWRPVLAQALAERPGDDPRPTPLALSVKAATALGCLNIALDHWTASDGRPDLTALLDEAFAALAG